MISRVEENFNVLWNSRGDAINYYALGLSYSKRF